MFIEKTPYLIPLNYLPNQKLYYFCGKQILKTPSYYEKKIIPESFRTVFIFCHVVKQLC